MSCRIATPLSRQSGTLLLLIAIICAFVFSPFTYSAYASEPAESHGDSAGHGAEADAHGEGGTRDFIFKMINFAALLILLYFALRKPLGNYLDARAEKIRASLREAEENRAKAKEKSAELDRRFANLEEEVAAIQTTAQQEGEVERDRIIARAHEDAQRILEHARTEVENEIRLSKDRLQKDVTDLAVRAAEQMISDGIDEQDRDRLFEKYLKQLAEADS